MKRKLVSVLLAFAVIGSSILPVSASDFSAETEYADLPVLQEEAVDGEAPSEASGTDEVPAQAEEMIPQTEPAAEEQPVESAPDISLSETADFDEAGSSVALYSDVEGNTELFGKCGPYLNYKVSDGVMTIDGTGETYRSGWYPSPEKITSVTVLQGATEIGAGMFSGFTALQSITLPASVTRIEDEAFRSCSSLTGFTFPAGVTEIGYGIFSGCSSLTEVALPESLTKIPNGMFLGCAGLKSCTFSDQITEIGINAFNGCASLGSITFPASLSVIGEAAFSGCASLDSLTLPKTLQTVGRYAFSGCSGLETIVLERGLTSISDNEFSDIGNVVITIPDTVTSIASTAFNGTDPLIQGYLGSIAELYANQYGFTFKNILTGENTTREGMCGDHAYYKVTNGIMTISGYGSMFDYAWYPETGSGDVTAVRINSGSVQNIGASAFAGFWALGEVSIPDTVLFIDNKAFANCTSLIEISIPASVQRIGNDAFSGCETLVKVTIPEDSLLKNIGRNAFSGCTELSSITLPASLDTTEGLGVYAFYGCTALTQITIPEGITEIKTGTFAGSNLSTVSLPDTLEIIGTRAFSGTAFTELTLSKNVKEIRDSAFADCKSLKKINLGSSAVSIGAYAFQGCTSLSSVSLPATLESVSVYAFAGCTTLKTIAIPASVTSIAEHAFAENTSDNTTAANVDVNLPNLTIQGYIGSKAESYANEKKIPFLALDTITSLSIPQVTATNTSKGVSLSWKLIPGASEYYVYRKLSGGKYSKIATLKSYENTYADTTVSANKVYLYAVKAVHDKVSSKYKAVTIRYLKVPKPTLSNTVDGVTIKWSKITGAKKYYVYRKIKGAASYTRLVSLSSSTLSYADATAVSGTTYLYAVRAINGSDKSAYKSVEKTYVATPQLTITNAADGPKLTWAAVENCSQYVIYRKAGDGNYVRLVATDALTYQDTSAVSGTTYVYGAVAIIGSANSGMAGVKDIYLSEVKTAAKNVSTGVRLTWNSVTGAKKYIIYRKTGTGKLKKLTSVDSKTLKYTDKTVTAGNTYTYCVRAYNGGYYGSYVTAKVTAK